MQFIDIHTHRKENPVHTFSLRSYDLAELHGPPGHYHTVGCHPWYSVYDDSLIHCASDEMCLAIGECGLDKLWGPSLAVQMDSLDLQISLSERIQKPMILHVVKAYNEIIALRKRHNPSQPWIVHGFNKNATVAKALMDAGFYLSFGEALRNERMQSVLAGVREDRILAETDDSTVEINEVYKYMATACGSTTEKVEQLISRNFKNVFGSDANELVRTR